jgi:hypothetical protein
MSIKIITIYFAVVIVYEWLLSRFAAPITKVKPDTKFSIYYSIFRVLNKNMGLFESKGGLGAAARPPKPLPPASRRRRRGGQRGEGSYSVPYFCEALVFI